MLVVCSLMGLLFSRKGRRRAESAGEGFMGGWDVRDVGKASDRCWRD
jgi:hypothetical protein